MQIIQNRLQALILNVAVHFIKTAVIVNLKLLVALSSVRVFASIFAFVVAYACGNACGLVAAIFTMLFLNSALSREDTVMPT